LDGRFFDSVFEDVGVVIDEFDESGFGIDVVFFIAIHSMHHHEIEPLGAVEFVWSVFSDSMLDQSVTKSENLPQMQIGANLIQPN
jgi:hypothetical protein